METVKSTRRTEVSSASPPASLLLFPFFFFLAAGSVAPTLAVKLGNWLNLASAAEKSNSFAQEAASDRIQGIGAPYCQPTPSTSEGQRVALRRERRSATSDFSNLTVNGTAGEAAIARR